MVIRSRRRLRFMRGIDSAAVSVMMLSVYTSEVPSTYNLGYIFTVARKYSCFGNKNGLDVG